MLTDWLSGIVFATAAMAVVVAVVRAVQLQGGSRRFAIAMPLYVLGIGAGDVVSVTFAGGTTQAWVELATLALSLPTWLILMSTRGPSWRQVAADSWVAAACSMLVLIILGLAVGAMPAAGSLLATVTLLKAVAAVWFVFTLVRNATGGMRFGRMLLLALAVRAFGRMLIGVRAAGPAIPTWTVMVVLVTAHLLIALAVLRRFGRGVPEAGGSSDVGLTLVGTALGGVGATTSIIGFVLSDAVRQPITVVLALSSALLLAGQLVMSLRSYAKVHAELARQEEHYRNLVQNSSDVILIAGADGRVEYVSPTISSIVPSGPPGETWAGTPVSQALGLNAAEYEDAVQRLDVSREVTTVYLRGETGGRMLEAALSLGGRKVLVSVRDITEREQMRRQLQNLAFRDELTGLPNRLQVATTLQHRLATEPDDVVAMFIDLNHFKEINDAGGHADGDLALQIAAERLAGTVGDRGLVGRLGGDEFVVVLGAPTSSLRGTVIETHSSTGATVAEQHEPTDSDTDTGTDTATDSTGDDRSASEAAPAEPSGSDLDEHAEWLAERICKAMQVPTEVRGREYRIGCAVGIARGADGLSADDLLRNADLAMYHAKRRRLEWQVFRPTMAEAERKRTATDKAALRAWRTAPVQLNLQPVVDLANNRVVAAEALLRWTDAEGVTRSPIPILNLAHRSGQEAELTYRVLRTAFTKMRDSSDPCAIAINVPAVTLRPRLIRDIERLVSAHDAEPGRLQLEIDASSLEEAPRGMADVVRHIRELGLLVEVDRFGGRSGALDLLLELPITGVKIDRSFVHLMPEEAAARAVVSGLVAICGELGLTTTAAGVQLAEQHRLAVELGVERGQGLFYAGPADVDSLDDVSELASWPRMSVA